MVLTAVPIDERDVPVFATYAEAAASGRLARISLGVHPGFRKPGDALPREEFAFLIPRGRIAVIDRLCVALTPDGGFLPASFPKDWPYAAYLDRGALALPVSGAPINRIEGDWVCPFMQPDHSHLYHSLFDNYGRLAWMARLGVNLPILYAATYPADALMTAIAQVFFRGAKAARIEVGLHECERLLLPPPGNRDDRYYPCVAEFLRARLCAAFTRERYTHPTRLFVSRADTPVRNVVNEPELIAALNQRGFQALCPGEYSTSAQFELFAAAETIVGVHGMGLMPMLTARACRRIVEIEALDWAGTAFSGMAGVFGIDYRRVGGELIPFKPREGYHWLARVNVEEVLAALES